MKFEGNYFKEKGLKICGEDREEWFLDDGFYFSNGENLVSTEYGLIGTQDTIMDNWNQWESSWRLLLFCTNVLFQDDGNEDLKGENYEDRLKGEYEYVYIGVNILAYELSRREERVQNKSSKYLYSITDTDNGSYIRSKLPCSE